MNSITQNQINSQIASTYGKGDAFEKGEVSDAFNYGSDPIKFVKTGKEIKDKLPIILEALKAKQIEVSATLVALRVAIGSEPTDLSGYNNNFKTYPYTMCSSQGEVCCDTTYPSQIPIKEGSTDCSKYNQLAYALSDIQRDVATLSLVENNLKDEQKYSLTTSQLVALHF